ncbi:MAG: HNH endonuclease, partial [Oscillochloris sp.]|nr:HNH endonuclease [Oscillochloris sp.]
DIQAQARRPLKDAAAVNTTRWALYQRLVATGLPVEVGTGGRTKFNRTRLGLAKAHWLDAACVGASTPELLDVRGVRPLRIRATGRGTRQVCRTNASGFPTRHKPRARTCAGWQTGDLARAVIATGKYAGTHVGRVAIRFRPSFRLDGRFDVHPKYLTRIQRADGYQYAVLGASPAS